MPVQEASRGTSDAAGPSEAAPALNLPVTESLALPALQNPLESVKITKWNTQNLGLRVGADAASAAAAGLLVAPIVCTIDRYEIDGTKADEKDV
jgi:hypothetical protein